MIDNKNNIGFFRRFAALWIDIFVIYSITKIIIVLISLIDFRISFGTLFIFIGAIYSTIMLFMQRQTIGKMLMQIIVTSKTNDIINFRNILLREAFGKWGITLLIPMTLGLILLGNNWVPTVYDLFIMIPVIVLCIIYYFFTKHMWYEHLAGLTVRRNPSAPKAKIGFYSLIIVAVLGIGASLTEYLVKDRLPCRVAAFQNMTSTIPYVNFLKEQSTNPVDYVIDLFDKYDVVVLCERYHPEMTQWDYIYDVIRDPRFISKVGHVFTEYGQVGMQDYMNKFMLTDSLTETEVHNHVIHIMRNMPVWPSWTNYNLYKYLKRLYHLNQTLSRENRIQHHFTDAAVDWSAITTKEKFIEYWDNYVWNRDEIMAKTIIEEMKLLSKSANKPPKCLVIMNYRHAMDLTNRLPNLNRENTYEFLKDSFGNRAANVMINSSIFFVPVASGVWDAAFEKIENKSLGFNFQGSPFGSCYFDSFPFSAFYSPISRLKTPSVNGGLRYQDVFTGFVFINPTKDQYIQENTPGYYDGFEKEYIRRSGCISDEFQAGAKREMKSLKLGPPYSIKKPVEFIIEAIIELFFYGFSGIGLLIGILAFIFRKRKILIENNN